MIAQSMSHNCNLYMSKNRSRNWVFTLNNPSELEDPKLWNGVRYLVYQREAGENQTPHLQGYVVMQKVARRSALKKLNPRCHWEVRRGTHDEAREYCMKEEGRLEGPFEVGDPPDKQGKRSDLEAVKDRIIEGASSLEIANEFFGQWIRYNRAFDKYKLLLKQQRNEETIVSVYYGPTGTGKSRCCREKYPNAYWKSNSKWWDGYEGQEHVVIDEFYGWFPYDFILRLLDRYPLNVETKGGIVAFTSKYIHITSNQSPNKWYKPSLAYAPLERRIHNIYYLSDIELPRLVLKEHGELKVVQEDHPDSSHNPSASCFNIIEA